MRIESCRDCANLEDRRDIDKVALCAMHHGPSVCCQEFKPKNENVDPNRAYDRFCVNCANFEEIDGIPLCAKEHRPGIACGGFNSKIEQTTPKTATKNEDDHHRTNFYNKNTHST